MEKQTRTFVVGSNGKLCFKQGSREVGFWQAIGEIFTGAVKTPKRVSVLFDLADDIIKESESEKKD